jgi:DNA primase
MTQKGYSKAELLSAGLVVQNKNGRLYDKFRNRLMLPVVDTRGDVVAFGSRVIDNSEPKYMNSSETPVYSKRRVLYGLNLAKKTKRSNIILCEGNLDIVTLHQAGFDNAVASMGTALTTEQIRLLSRFTKELVLCYDNDNAGKIATERALQLLNNSEFSVKVLQLPRRLVDGEYRKQDADDFIKFQGPDAFERLLNGSENGIEFRMAQVAAKHDLASDEARVAYCEEIAQLLAELTNETQREIYAARAAAIASVPTESLKYEISKIINKRLKQAGKKELRKALNPATEIQQKSKTMRIEHTRSALSELGLIRLLTLDPGLFNKEFPLDGNMFSFPLYGKVFSLLWKEHISGRHPEIISLSNVLTQDEMSYMISALQSDNKNFSTNRAQMLEDYIRIVKTEANKRTGSGPVDPLLAATEKYKDKKGTGGKR